MNPCPTYHDTWKEYQSKVVEIGLEHDPTDVNAAFELVREQTKIPIGIIFKQNRPTLVDRRCLQDPLPGDRASTHEKLAMKQLLETYR